MSWADGELAAAPPRAPKGIVTISPDNIMCGDGR
jgi:hypothetical protein